MGLDMFVYRTKRAVDGVDFEISHDDGELHYWRKHPNMHGWMVKLYHNKGGQNNPFWMDTVAIKEEDINDLERAILDNALPFTEGCFFGVSTPDKCAGDVDFIAKASAALAAGDRLYYWAIS